MTRRALLLGLLAAAAIGGAAGATFALVTAAGGWFALSGYGRF